MEQTNSEICCPKFNPTPWDEKTITWENKRFIKATSLCIFHMPLNLGSVITKLCSQAAAAGAEIKDDNFILLTKDLSNWKAEQYLSVSKEVPGAENITLSGTYLTKVFEGPYQNAGKWYLEMLEYVKKQGKTSSCIYFFYTTCPKCAKKYGKNYTVILAQIA